MISLKAREPPNAERSLRQKSDLSAATRRRHVSGSRAQSRLGNDPGLALAIRRSLEAVAEDDERKPTDSDEEVYYEGDGIRVGAVRRHSSIQAQPGTTPEFYGKTRRKARKERKTKKSKGHSSLKYE